MAQQQITSRCVSVLRRPLYNVVHLFIFSPAPAGRVIPVACYVRLVMRSLPFRFSDQVIKLLLSQWTDKFGTSFLSVVDE